MQSPPAPPAPFGPGLTLRCPVQVPEKEISMNRANEGKRPVGESPIKPVEGVATRRFLKLVFMASCVIMAARGGVLLNPGFESPLASGGDVFGASDWVVFGGGTFTTSLLPHSGDNAFKVFGDTSGAFQEFPASAGETWVGSVWALNPDRSEEHTSELQSPCNLV